jgi:hypothetical protein
MTDDNYRIGIGDLVKPRRSEEVGRVITFTLASDTYTVAYPNETVNVKPWAIRLAQGRLIGKEMLTEVDWLIDSGVSAALVPQTLGRSADSIAQTAHRHGRTDLQTVFWRLVKDERAA